MRVHTSRPNPTRVGQCPHKLGVELSRALTRGTRVTSKGQASQATTPGGVWLWHATHIEHYRRVACDLRKGFASPPHPNLYNLAPTRLARTESLPTTDYFRSTRVRHRAGRSRGSSGKKLQGVPHPPEPLLQQPRRV